MPRAQGLYNSGGLGLAELCTTTPLPPVQGLRGWMVRTTESSPLFMISHSCDLESTANLCNWMISALFCSLFSYLLQYTISVSSLGQEFVFLHIFKVPKQANVTVKVKNTHYTTKTMLLHYQSLKSNTSREGLRQLSGGKLTHSPLFHHNTVVT